MARIRPIEASKAAVGYDRYTSVRDVHLNQRSFATRGMSGHNGREGPIYPDSFHGRGTNARGPTPGIIITTLILPMPSTATANPCVSDRGRMNGRSLTRGSALRRDAESLQTATMEVRK
jgi:hypothetical protein